MARWTWLQFRDALLHRGPSYNPDPPSVVAERDLLRARLDAVRRVRVHTDSHGRRFSWETDLRAALDPEATS